jgi:DNA-binding NtrC family response regulator
VNTTTTTPPSAARPDPRLAAGQEQRVLRVWMVDDNPSLRGLFSKLLDGRSNLSCTRGFGSGEEILTTLREERPPDVILLDINLGEEDGLELIRPIRKLAPGVKVLMFTQFRNVHYASEAFKAGASGFLIKSYEPGDIVRMIRSSCDQPEATSLFPAQPQAETGTTDTRTAPAAPRAGLLKGLSRWLHLPQSRVAL